jgi:hypothetical protein
MDWLITFKRTRTSEDIGDVLARFGVSVPDAPIPLGEDEWVVAVAGPRDLPTRLQSEPSILKVSPNSTQTLY